MSAVSRRGFVRGTLATLALPGTAAATQDVAPHAGGRVSFVIHPEPTTLVCFNTTEGPAIQASTKVVEGLLTYDFELNPRPQLATAWSISEDGLQYRFELRRNVKWHDGQPFTAERFQKLPHLTLETRGYEYSPTLYGIEFNLDRPILKNSQVRKAIAHTIDPAVVLNVAWYGLGERTVSIVSPTLKRFYNPNVTTYPYDPKAAARLLDEAGFPLKGRWRFALTHDFQPFGENFKRSGEALKSALAVVGIDVTVRGQDFPSYLKRVYSDRDYDFSFHPFTNMFDPTVGLQRFFTSDNYRKGVAFTNASHYANPDIDRLFAEIAVESDQLKRKALIDRFQEIVADDLPVLPLMLSKPVTVANRRVVGHTVDSAGVQGNFANVWLRG